MNRFAPVKELPGDTAGKIAAGEVIDRPNAVVRELIDNSLDAGATEISLEIQEGGSKKIRICDNGAGMTREDLEICWKPHTTSKISRAEDLLNISTLGFRGEALSSICAVSTMKITSVRNNEENAAEGNGISAAWNLETSFSWKNSGKENSAPMEVINYKISPGRLEKGTIIEIRGLFDNFPARKAFLKKPGAETLLCRQTFQEKALAWPQVAFSLTTDNKLRYLYPGKQSLLERTLSVTEPVEPASFFKEISETGDGFCFKIILGTREVVRKDKKDMMIFVNGRRIFDYGLIQAMDYGAEGFFPNGSHPFAYLFLEINPKYVDFNIHPAKKEIRIRNKGEIHHEISSAVRDFYKNLTLSNLFPQKNGTEKESSPDSGTISIYGKSAGNFPDFETKADSKENIFPEIRNEIEHGDNLRERLSPTLEYSPATEMQFQNPKATDSMEISGANPGNLKTETGLDFRYIGQVFNLFLVAEYKGKLYLIDQHAAHERILYDQLLKTSGTCQELLIPYIIETETEKEDRYLENSEKELKAAGFDIAREGKGKWCINGVPVRWKGSVEDLKHDLLHKDPDSETLLKSILARTACRQAVKKGDPLDYETARGIVEKTFKLPHPFCPHGRPVWIEFSPEKLTELVSRT